MKKRILIALGFRARAGKNTVADYLEDAYGFKQTAFADALKEGCRHMFGLTDAQLYGNMKEVQDEYWGVTPRYILQKVGTECMRVGYDENIWVKTVGKKLASDPAARWVISDCRFPNEATAVKKWGGLMVRVDRSQAGASGGIAQHPSEIAMESYNEWNHVVDNQGRSLNQLYFKVDELMKNVLE